MVLVQVEAFWVVTSCSVGLGYQRFWGPCWYAGILPQHYTASQHRRPWLQHTFKVFCYNCCEKSGISLYLKAQMYGHMMERSKENSV